MGQIIIKIDKNAYNVPLKRGLKRLCVIALSSRRCERAHPIIPSEELPQFFPELGPEEGVNVEIDRTVGVPQALTHGPRKVRHRSRLRVRVWRENECANHMTHGQRQQEDDEQ